MLNQNLFLRALFFSTFTSLFLGCSQAIKAQIAPDGTLGTESSQVRTVSPQEQIIEGGAVRGANLLQSFEQFSVGENQTVNFANPENISNIFGRVTGGDISQILGNLGVLGEANLWLLNPNGFIFGENASLNLSGSFVATTAESINFANGTQFSSNVTNARGEPLLTISQPTALEFGAQPGNIINRAQSFQLAQTNFQLNSLGLPAGLFVQNRGTLALIGGDIISEGGNLTAPGGLVELGAVSANSLVSLELVESTIVFDYRVVKNFSDIIFTNRNSEIPFGDGQVVSNTVPSAINVSSNTALGLINLRGKNIDILNGSQLQAIGSSPASFGGNISIQAQGQLNIEGFNLFFGFPSSSSVAVAAFGDVDAGSIKIETNGLILKNGATIRSDASDRFNPETGESVPSRGKGGNISINATDFIQLDGDAKILGNSVGTGNAGEINLQSSSLTLRGNSEIAASAVQSDGGNINLVVGDAIELREASQISASVGDTGDGGNIDITTNFLLTSPQDNSDITASAELGMGGNINIDAAGIFGIEFQPVLTDFSDLTVSSQFGLDGTLTLANPDLQSSNFESSDELVFAAEPSIFIPNSCRAYLGNKYTITGRGGIPLVVKNTLRSEFGQEDWRIISPNSAQEPLSYSLDPIANKSPKTTTQAAPTIQGWYTNDRGEVVLTSEPLLTTPQATAVNPGC